MKKQFLPLFLFPFVLFSCNKPVTDMPKSPFNDSYKRIGMVGEYDVNIESLPAEEYAKLKEGIDKYKEEINQDKNVTKFVRREETRDLKYAYFGKEISSVSLCSMLSRTDTESRYVQGNEKNYVTTKEANSSLQNQTANAGIIKTDSTTVDYIYDVHYVNSGVDAENKYGVRTSVKNNDEAIVVTQATPESTEYVSEKFDLKPYEDIKENFNQGRTEPIDFHLLGNSAVTGTCEIDGKERYIIKEGYSAFAPYTTTVGRTYKAVDNYFYEGLLEKYTEPTHSEESYRFISFRFYHELLILSKAYDAGVPVLYLEKPMLVDFSEIKYDISYADLGECKVVIPDPTNK